MVKGSIVPLAFSTFGAVHPETEKYLEVVANLLSGGSTSERGRMIRLIRERVAIAIAVQQGRLIQELNVLNRGHHIE